MGELVRAGKTDEAEARKASLGSLGDQIAALDSQLAFVEAELEADLLLVPNPPRDEVPDGAGPEDNPVVRSWGEPLPAGDRPPHWEIGARLNLFDLERGAKIAGTGFVLYTGTGARLVRALIGLFLDMATQRGYTEVWPPILVNEDSARGTGQIPDKEAQMYAVERDGLYLAPTAEVPVTNIHRDEILALSALPIRYAAYTPCFRREAGAAGKDTRGLLRVHQFDKVELVKFVTPETSDAELETLTADAEAVLQALELPYRTVERCTGDVGFAQARGYDLEAWAPGRREVARDQLVLQLHRFPGAAHERPLPISRRCQARARPHPERLGRGPRPDHRGAPGEPPPARWLGGHSGGPAPALRSRFHRRIITAEGWQSGRMRRS